MPNEEKQNKIYENLIEELEEQSSVFLPQGISYELNIFNVRAYAEKLKKDEGIQVANFALYILLKNLREAQQDLEDQLNNTLPSYLDSKNSSPKN